MVQDLKYSGHWREVRSRILNKYKDLDPTDLDIEQSGSDVMVGRLSQKLGISKSEVRDMISKA